MKVKERQGGFNSREKRQYQRQYTNSRHNGTRNTGCVLRLFNNTCPFVPIGRRSGRPNAAGLGVVAATSAPGWAPRGDLLWVN